MLDVSKFTGIIDLDAMLHTVAYVQFSSGNKDDIITTKAHVSRFIATIKSNANCKDYISFFQKQGHTNFRNEILPEYKGHRETTEFIKCWKPTILEAFEESGAIGLDYIESDDACRIVSKLLDYKSVIVTSDKDMVQVPTMLYNPYKKGAAYNDLTRWYYSNEQSALKFYWAQVLAGDSGDMPNSLCGIEGVGIKTANKIIDSYKPKSILKKNFPKIVQEQYTKKYGSKALDRAVRTMQMVRILDGSETYINENAKKECEKIKNKYKTYIESPKESITASLFAGKTKTGKSLFKK